MSNYPAGASNDPNAPFNQLDQVVCSECDTQLDEDFCCPNEEYHHNLYKAKFWVYEIQDFVSWNEFRKFSSTT